ncbi:hypothetical protein [Oceanicella sp. SM1341]|uniref:hypothetical protein n=1 Tax=Oceanicella sp. SM1341 TaxID=1548889 RepID=UPI001300B170|nr:hypothetical protein [Oceanicella sp. SM1341]
MAALLPPGLIPLLARLGRGDLPEAATRADMAALRAALSLIPPDRAPVLERELRAAAGWWARDADQGLARALGCVPELGWLLLFHPDGHLRERAAGAITDSAATPFEVAAIALRLNDWAAPVRDAARGLALRALPEEPAAPVAGFALGALRHTREWGRWGAVERAVLERAIARPLVADHIAARLMQNRSGPLGTALHDLMRSPVLDRHLPALARGAARPDIRALATEALLRGEARWRAGWRREWIDRVFNLARRAPDIARRPLTVPAPEGLLAEAAGARALMLRKVAARHLETGPAHPGEDRAAAARVLAEDPNPAVRERARRWLSEATADGSSPAI